MATIIDKITAGNYWLTKSMEFNKIQKCGTLWYLKKWIVIYYYVFLKEKIYTQDYQDIIKIFENFIDSLPIEQKEDAINFFFEIDIRSDDFIKYSDFLDISEFDSVADEKQFKIEAKRYYFMYLMASGGQSGWKEKIKDKINEGKGYSVVKSEISDEMRLNNKTIREIREQLSDFPAPIRNERQIFFYYGFFHGKDAADMSGFYNLTPIGKTILKANFHELVLIWEHQKIKMLSQSPISDIQKLKPTYDTSFFAINYHPYLDFVKILYLNKSISLEEYQYVYSKTKTTLPIETIIEYYKENGINNFIKKAKEFQRNAETKNEDFAKELKKYLLGISELNKDYKKNPYAFVSYIKKGKIEVTNENKLSFTYKVQNILREYLDKKYSDKYKKFEKKLKEKYIATVNNTEYKLDNETKYEWGKYIINFDETIFFNLVYWSISNINEKYDFNFNQNEIKATYENYKNLLKIFGISKKEYTSIMEQIQYHLKDDNIYFIKEEYEFDELVSLPKEISQEISIQNLEKISINNSDIYITSKRKRNSQLINLLRAYFINNFKDKETNLIKCDSCGEYTFLTYNDFPYLEFHHIIPFSTELGPDHYLNLIGICPNCHRKLHFSKPEQKNILYSDISKNNNLKIDLINRINQLFEQKQIEPIHLEFLLKENIIDENTYNEFMNKSITAA